MMILEWRMPRRMYKNVQWQDEYGASFIGREIASFSDADVISSELENSKLHAPVLDIDMPAYLVPSAQKDHYHLYIDCEMTWRQYKRVLKAMAKAGILEKGYVKASIRRRHTAVRPPWKKKEVHIHEHIG